ncbi:FMN reductase [Gordonia sp. CPCC 206044]|uniref:FMN reductase n=1 Tax=Gordonia sp. CPCC 206044 TaxID=3140793 RepID=UPI003AF35CAC
MTSRLVAVNAGLGDPSSTRLLVDRLVEATSHACAGTGVTPEIRVIDVRELAVDIARSLTTGFAIGAASEAIEAVQDADGLIVASPVFNASYSGLFKSFFDLVDIERMQGKPVLLAATGGSPRHSMVLDHALRPLFSYLRAATLPTGVYAASQDWAGTSGDTAALSDRIERAAGELAAALDDGRGTPTQVRHSSPASPEVTDRRHAQQAATEAAGIANFARLLGETD